MYNSRNLLMVLCLSGLGIACTQPEQTATPPQPLPENVTFAEHIQPMIDVQCAKCHVVASKGKLLLDSHENAMKGGKSGPVVVPGDSAGSKMFALVTSTDEDNRMPPKGSRLSPYEVGLIQKWIDQGAL